MIHAKVQVAAAMSLIAVSACTAQTEDATNSAQPAPMTPTTAAAAPAIPLYISNKRVSTDCGIDYAQDPPPGFSHRPGRAPAPMPPPIVAN
ncbi:MAG: hypothetical protein KJO76_04655, partial [Gammaproteobacteria bacterium]|nr:hypothetical protein [Gammaproteobacteria bacterium]